MTGFWKQRNFPKLWSCSGCGQDFVANFADETFRYHEEHGKIIFLFYIGIEPNKWNFSRKYMLTTVTVFGVFIFLFAIYYAAHLLSHFF